MDPIQAQTQEQGDNNTQKSSPTILKEVGCVFYICFRASQVYNI